VNAIKGIISQLEQQRSAIDRAISALRDVEGVEPVQTKSDGPVAAKQPKRRRMSAAARRRIGEATRKRWADKRAAETALAEKTAPSKKASATKKAGRKRATKSAAA
jgi:hypothetical protein